MQEQELNAIPTKLTALRNWVRWTYKETQEGKKTKIPLCLDGSLASTTDPKTWTAYKEVKKFNQVGFVFTKDSGIVGIDLDHVITQGKLLQWAECVVEDANSYTEISPSGTGLHIVAFGAKPEWLDSRYDLGQAGLEIYDTGRYFTVTGNVFRNYSTMREINLERVFDFLKPTERVQTAAKARPVRDSFDIRIDQVVSGLPEEENMPHPFHDSTTGANFRIDRGYETWRCWRHSCTGNALHLLGQREAIIECGDKPSKEQWREILKVAEKEGLVEPYQERKEAHVKKLVEQIKNAQW
jgi:hypothetical protein